MCMVKVNREELLYEKIWLVSDLIIGDYGLIFVFVVWDWVLLGNWRWISKILWRSKIVFCVRWN